VNQTLIFASFLAPTRYKMCLYMTEYVERTLGIPTFLLNGESFEDFASEDADAGLISPLAYARLLSERAYPVELLAVPVFQNTDEANTPPGLVKIVVRKESEMQSESDLELCTWAYHASAETVEEPPYYAREPLALHCRSMVEATSPAQALRMVLDGAADATAIDARLFALVHNNSPHMCDRLRILNTCCRTPGPLVVVASHVHPRLKLQIQECLVKMHTHSLFAQQLHEMNIQRFMAASDEYYQTLQTYCGKKETVNAPMEARIALRVPANI
jgi:ABC-type phosphate/phosphonate transport system substrate-binding protein